MAAGSCYAEDVLAPDLKAFGHSATTPQNREEILQGIRMWTEAFSDSFYTIEEQLAESDRVATRVSFHSTRSLGPDSSTLMILSECFRLFV